MKRLLQNAAVVAFSVLLALVVAEVAIQAFPSLVPEKHEYLAERIANRNLRSLLDFRHRDEPYVHHRSSDSFAHHPTFGWTMTPNLERTIWGYDGRFTIRTNSRGFRDAERTESSQRPTVLALGDSFVWGLFLEEEELVPVLLEGELRAKGFEVDVVNYGMAGWGTDQELLLLRELGPLHRPEVVVLFFFYSNDFRNNESRARAESAHPKPWFTLDEAGELVLHGVPVPEREGSSAPSSAPAAERTGDLHRRSFLWSLARKPAGRERPPVPSNAAAPPIPGRNPALTAALLRELDREAMRQGAPLVTVLFPGYGFERGQRGAYEATRAFFEEELPELDLLDLTPAFERAEGPLHGRMVEHWNAEGARLVAREIARYLSHDYGTALR